MRALLVILSFSFHTTLAQDSVITNIIGMEFVRINPGSMIVGKFQPTVDRPSDPNKNSAPEALYVKAEAMAKEAYSAGFEVKLDQPYYIGRYEVTQAQWQKVMGSNPSAFTDKHISNASLHPVENVTWKDVQKFIKKINALDQNYTYRLPTEFEWEYAARAGNTDDIAWSEIVKCAVLGGSTTSQAGQKQPNAWGLYDMLGNVWEWTQDVYNEKIFADPQPPRSGKEHVLKGSSFTGDVKNATYMTHAAGPGNGFDVGFRLVMEVKSKSN